MALPLCLRLSFPTGAQALLCRETEDGTMADGRHGGNVWDGGRPEQWLDFSANLRPEGPPEWVMRVMQDALADTRYYPDRAMTAARQGLAAYAGVPEACILPTAGGAAAIDLTLQRRHGTVHVEPVTFGEYAERAGLHGREVAVWRGKCGADDTLVLCNPNNPTGQCRSRDEVLALYAQASRQGGEMMVDEAFMDYCPENSVRRDVQPGLSVVGSLTKTLGIPGVRLGYVCAAPEVIADLARRALPWAVGTLAAAVAQHLPEHLAEIARDAEVNRRRREAFAAQLTRLGAEVLPSRSNFLLADFHRDMAEVAAGLRARGILVRACASFGLPGRYLRLAVRTQEENDRLIREMEAMLHAR